LQVARGLEKSQLARVTAGHRAAGFGRARNSRPISRGRFVTVALWAALSLRPRVVATSSTRLGEYAGEFHPHFGRARCRIC